MFEARHGYRRPERTHSGYVRVGTALCTALGAVLSLAFTACSSGKDSFGEGGVQGGNTGSPAVPSGSSSGTSSGGSFVLGVGGVGTGGSAGSGAACSTVSTSADTQSVYLVFAFDVSGSMGQGDYAWHDADLKWRPVVSATKSFFADPTAAGFTASLEFFPTAGGEDQRCSLAAYEAPDVPATPLPSPAFATAIDAIDPTVNGPWRGGTPTAWVIRGSLAYAAAQQTSAPGRYVLVLVTDGYPQGCDDGTDDVQVVAADIATAHAGGIATYVIGIANPPVAGAPDTVTNLNQLALAGGTNAAFLIDTGNPDETSAAFTAALDEIRQGAVSCNLRIPSAPDGREFDKSRVRVSLTGSSAAAELPYDDGCTQGGWRYDDPAAPTQIILCSAACARANAGIDATLNVEFTCNDVVAIPE